MCPIYLSLLSNSYHLSLFTGCSSLAGSGITKGLICGSFCHHYEPLFLAWWAAQAHLALRLTNHLVNLSAACDAFLLTAFLKQASFLMEWSWYASSSWWCYILSLSLVVCTLQLWSSDPCPDIISCTHNPSLHVALQVLILWTEREYFWEYLNLY